jgi:8-oxo-dGTP pyrophosphatase MutT (NUDIX family)
MIFNGEVAVVKNWFGPNSWQLPGGGMKKTENVVSTAVREIQEEFNFKMDAGAIQQLTQNPLLTSVGGIFYRYQYVLCRLDSSPTLTVSHGITDIKWGSPSSVKMPDSIRSRAL